MCLVYIYIQMFTYGYNFCYTSTNILPMMSAEDYLPSCWANSWAIYVLPLNPIFPYFQSIGIYFLSIKNRKILEVWLGAWSVQWWYSQEIGIGDWCPNSASIGSTYHGTYIYSEKSTRVDDLMSIHWPGLPFLIFNLLIFSSFSSVSWSLRCLHFPSCLENPHVAHYWGCLSVK